jgi:hypothetical protein
VQLEHEIDPLLIGDQLDEGTGFEPQEVRVSFAGGEVAFHHAVPGERLGRAGGGRGDAGQGQQRQPPRRDFRAGADDLGQGLETTIQ